MQTSQDTWLLQSAGSQWSCSCRSRTPVEQHARVQVRHAKRPKPFPPPLNHHKAPCQCHCHPIHPQRRSMPPKPDHPRRRHTSMSHGCTRDPTRPCGAAGSVSTRENAARAGAHARLGNRGGAREMWRGCGHKRRHTWPPIALVFFFMVCSLLEKKV